MNTTSSGEGEGKVHTAYIAEVRRPLELIMYEASNAVEDLKQPQKRLPIEKVEAMILQQLFKTG